MLKVYEQVVLAKLLYRIIVILPLIRFLSSSMMAKTVPLLSVHT